MEQLESKREALRRRMSRPARAGKPARDRRRWGWLLLLLLILLLWLLLPECAAPPEPLAPPAPASSVQLAPAEAPAPPEPPPPPLPRRARPSFDSEPPETLPWVSAFRMQVAARSPRLAECFVGVARPGRLKWTAAVEPVHGQVSDHTLEPTLQSDALTQQQRDCVLGVLSDPPYRLHAGEERSTPSRVGMVIEF
jgi:hypothetical protein